MTVSTTSKTAYHSIYKKIGAKQRAVYEAIGELGTASNEELASYLDWPINCITGRVCELKKYGMVGFEDYKTSRSGMKVKAWGVRSISDNRLMDLIKECEE